MCGQADHGTASLWSSLHSGQWSPIGASRQMRTSCGLPVWRSCHSSQASVVSSSGSGPCGQCSLAASQNQGSGLWSDLVRQRFQKATSRLGFNRERVELDLTQFRPPGVAGQGSLF